MARTSEKPTVTEKAWAGSSTTQEYSHPAYGQIVLTQRQGNTTLYGSDIGHHGTMAISITRSHMNRDLHRDWFGQDEVLVEFEMSHAQFVQFVTSQGNGSGTPITLRYAPEKGAKLDQLPSIDNLQSKADLHREEIKAAAQEEVDKLRGLIDRFGTMLGEGTISKKTLKEIHFALKCRADNLPGNLAFAVSSAEEALEVATAHAKVEVESYISLAINRLGLSTVGQLTNMVKQEEQKLLESGKDL